MTTPVYGLTEHGEGGSAGKVLANTAYRWTEARLLKDIGDNAPPGTPVDGDLHVVGSSPTGDWAGQANKVALYIVDAATAVGTWQFTAAVEGMFFYVDDAAGSGLAGKLVVYDGSAWGAVEGSGDTLPVNDTTSLVQDPVDTTKKMRIDVGNVATGTVRVLAMPNADVTLYKNNQTTTDPVAGDDDGDGYAVGSRWINTTSDEEFVCLDASTGAAVWTSTTSGGGAGGLSNVIEDTTPQLGGMLDVNGNAIGDGTRELLTFTEDASAVNHVNIENQATGGGPIISAAGDDTNVALNLTGKGTGTVNALTGLDVTGNITVSGTVDGVDVAAHASRHQSGGADPIKLDDLAAPDDNTDLDASASAHGLLPKLSGTSSTYLDGTGTWGTPAGGSSLPVDDTTSLVQDPVDTTKEVRIDAGLVSTGQVRVIAMADQNVSLVPNTGTYPAAVHGSRHQAGGADAIKLDDLAAPDDNTDLNASTSAHGLLPKLNNVATDFLNGQGGWTTPAGTSLPVDDATVIVQNGSGHGVIIDCTAFTGDRVLTPPSDANTTLVGTSANQTLTNKTLTSPSISSPTVTGSGIVVNTGGNPITITEGGISRSSGVTQAFNYQNTGAGVAQLQQDGVPVVTTTGTQTLTNKTLTTPTIGDFNNATHDHSSAAEGGIIEDLVWAIFFGGGPNILEFEEVTEPTTPSDGDAYFLAASPTGSNWSGQGGKIALYKGSTWYFRTPVNGTSLHVDTAASSHWKGARIAYSADESEWYPLTPNWWDTTEFWTGTYYPGTTEKMYCKCFAGNLDGTGDTLTSIAHGVTIDRTVPAWAEGAITNNSTIGVKIPQDFGSLVYVQVFNANINITGVEATTGYEYSLKFFYAK